MKSKILIFLKSYPVFVWLLPVFFVFHGYMEFYDLIPAIDATILAGVYLLAAIVLVGLFFLFFRNINKAAILVFLMLSFNFFFGPVHDWAKKNFADAFFTRYSFILPALVIFITAVIIVLKKRKKTLFQVTRYLNLVLLVLLFADIFILINKMVSTTSSVIIKDEFVNCSDCKKPDVYYILADEYAGKKQLNELLKFDNSAFENELRKREFHIVDDSRSNYNYTIFSSASILNMDYLPGIYKINQNIHDRRICFDVIKNNKTMRFFKQAGYEIYNYSIFDFPGQPTMAKPSILPVKTRPIIAQAFLFRLQRDLWYHLITDLKLASTEKNSIYNDKKNIENFLELTKKAAAKKKGKPKFIYTHLLMPHNPYYYDKDGKELKYELLRKIYDSTETRYISYLQYCNKVFLQLIDDIKSNSPEPPIIILMSDHGFKGYNNYDHVETYFSNFNSIYLPDSNYKSFYKGISNVNQFRVLFNSQFNQQLPLLKDSTIIITE